MKKYPPLRKSSIQKCLLKIDKNKFNTYEFIEVWMKLFPDDYTLFSGLWNGWRKVIGRELSLFCQTNAKLKKTKNRKSNAQVWSKK